MERGERRGLLALCAATMLCAAACGLAKDGLLVGGDDEDAGDAQTPTADVVVVDEGTGETSPSADVATPMDVADTADATEASIADVRRDRMEAGADVRAEAEAGMDADADARGGADADADARPEDADATLDSPPDVVGADAADATPDVTGPPLRYDGGRIVDPVFTDSDWVQFCAALAGCGQLPSITACDALRKQPSSADALFPPPDMVANVVNASPNCVVVEDALGDGLACSVPDMCTGNIFVTCRWGFRMTVDCGGLGMVCSPGPNGGCGFGPCDPGQEGLTYCAGSQYVARCTNGRYVPSADCSTFGGTCTGSPGAAACEGQQGIPCTGGSACAGTTLAACLDGLLGTVDCAQAYGSSFTCLDVDSGSAADPVCARGTACDPLTWQDTCSDSDDVSFCNAGEPATYNCSSNSWAGGCSAGKCTN